MAKMPRKTICCHTPWENDKNPLKLIGTGAECSLCGALYLLDVQDDCPHCGCTELLCGHYGPGCTSENNSTNEEGFCDIAKLKKENINEQKQEDNWRDQGDGYA